MLDILEPNEPVHLGSSTIIRIEDQLVDIPAELILRLLPTPVFTIEAVLPNVFLEKRPLDIELQNGACLRSVCGSFDLNTGEGVLLPQRQPVDVRDDGRPLSAVTFSLINFPQLLGNQSIPSINGSIMTSISHATLADSDWTVELTGVNNISEVCTTLQRDRGFGVTYTGRIIRTSGATFSVKRASVLLDALRMLLSFARGSACGVTLVEGQDEHGAQSWMRWGVHHVDSWRQSRSWFRGLNGADSLSELFPEHWRLFRDDRDWRSTMTRAIDWYLVSNTSPAYVGIVLTQAALEVLSHQELGREKKRGESTGKFVACATKGMGIDIRLGAGCEALDALARVGRLPANGLEAINSVRNDLVHAKQKLGELPNEVHHEAWNLGQWYIERMLLHKLHYQGSILNRLTGERHNRTTA